LRDDPDTTGPPEPRAPREKAGPLRGRWIRRLTPRQRRVLALLAVAEYFDSYDAALVSLALKQIQEGLAIPESEIASVAGTIRLGMLASFAVTLLADRMGRRRLLLITVIGFSFFTFVTAFARTPVEFMWAQVLARAFIGAEVMLAGVVIVEELSARDRGWGIGVLGALGALGHGGAAIGLGLIDVLPLGWRMLYLLGALPLLIVAWLRRNLPETERFEQHAATQLGESSAHDVLRPLAHLFTMYPRRLVSLSLLVFSFDLVHWTAFGFLAKMMQDLHGFDARVVATVVVVGGALGVMGNLVAGGLGGRIGWRPLIWALIALHGGSAWAFYNGGRMAAVGAWIGMVFAATGLGVIMKALGGELFPTSYRSTAAGTRLVVATLGGYVGYQTEGRLYPAALASLGDVPGAEQLAHAVAITWMLPLLIVPALLVLVIPETAGRELEDVSPERYEA
jgi:putative MFS transporter